MPELRGVVNNLYNPFGLNTEIKLNVIQDHTYFEMRESLIKEDKKVPLDNEMIVFEGCD